jgi:uncharacterized repeat protein (TIGR03803 family)
MKILRILLVIVLLVLAGRTFNAAAQTETNLHSFSGPTDGQSPLAGLVQGSDGNFYGTTYGGGTNYDGTVFRISPGGSYTNLYSFGNSPTDGTSPSAGLVQGSDGNFYGTTSFGGTSSNCFNCGTVFWISPSGSYTNLYSFGNSPNDGMTPYAGLVQGSDGNFYGTTYAGGANLYGGTVFRISPSGSYTQLYNFGSSPTDGTSPSAGLVQGSDGNFYGTTYFGGTSTNCVSGCGTVVRISPSGSETNLYSFGSSPTDGYRPEARLVQGSDGNFYGTTYGGGATSTNYNPICACYGVGTVFRISPSGSETNLHSFIGFPTDGANPYGGLVQGSDGNFYGTTDSGGTNYDGTVFRISATGSYSNLYSFGSVTNDGNNPRAGLVQGSDGNFYGTTFEGGTNNLGTVFKLTVPLSPPPYPINQITGVHVAATNIVFNVVSIAGETYQLQFSGSMKPTNWVNVAGVSVTNSIGALLTLTNSGGAVGPQGFYRFDITP